MAINSKTIKQFLEEELTDLIGKYQIPNGGEVLTLPAIWIGTPPNVHNPMIKIQGLELIIPISPSVKRSGNIVRKTFYIIANQYAEGTYTLNTAIERLEKQPAIKDINFYPTINIQKKNSLEVLSQDYAEIEITDMQTV